MNKINKLCKNIFKKTMSYLASSLLIFGIPLQNILVHATETIVPGVVDDGKGNVVTTSISSSADNDGNNVEVILETTTKFDQTTKTKKTEITRSSSNPDNIIRKHITDTNIDFLTKEETTTIYDTDYSSGSPIETETDVNTELYYRDLENLNRVTKVITKTYKKINGVRLTTPCKENITINSKDRSNNDIIIETEKEYDDSNNEISSWQQDTTTISKDDGSKEIIVKKMIIKPNPTVVKTITKLSAPDENGDITKSVETLVPSDSEFKPQESKLTEKINKELEEFISQFNKNTNTITEDNPYIEEKTNSEKKQGYTITKTYRTVLKPSSHITTWTITQVFDNEYGNGKIENIEIIDEKSKTTLSTEKTISSGDGFLVCHKTTGNKGNRIWFDWNFPTDKTNDKAEFSLINDLLNNNERKKNSKFWETKVEYYMLIKDRIFEISQPNDNKVKVSIKDREIKGTKTEKLSLSKRIVSDITGTVIGGIVGNACGDIVGDIIGEVVGNIVSSAIEQQEINRFGWATNSPYSWGSPKIDKIFEQEFELNEEFALTYLGNEASNPNINDQTLAQNLTKNSNNNIRLCAALALIYPWYLSSKYEHLFIRG